MSQSYYNKKWLEAQMTLSSIVTYEKPFKDAPPDNNKVSVFNKLATMYIRYIQVFRTLEQCYDQIVHPQKRRLLRVILENTAGRFLELKQELVTLEATDFNYYDDITLNLKLTPHDLEIPIPRYFLLEKQKVMQGRERLLGMILSRLVKKDPEKVVKPESMYATKEEQVMSMEDALKIIQIHERARQGRQRAYFMSELRREEELMKERMSRAKNLALSEMNELDAVLILQKTWRGFSQRLKTRQMREEEAVFLGMALPKTADPAKTSVALQTQMEEDRRLVQEMNESEFIQALVIIKEKVREQEGPDMKETLTEQIRQWFLECRDAVGRFPNFPSEAEGGSLKLFKDKDPIEVFKELEEAENEKNKKKEKGDKSKKKGKEKEKKDEKKKKKSGDEGWKMKESNFLKDLEETSIKYSNTWVNKDEDWNFLQRYDADLIRVEKREEVENEIRLQVDELMRQELKNLKLAIDKDKGKKGKGKSKSGKKKGKKGGKKGKKQKDLTPDRSLMILKESRHLLHVSPRFARQHTSMKNKKKDRDMTGNRSKTIESLYEELVCEGIIKRPAKCKLKDFVGEYSYIGTLLKLANIEPSPSLGDVRRIITEYAILPLGSAVVHEKAPLTKSILLAGPVGTGKKMLVNAICNETGANLIDLTATNITGKYPGKDGLKLLLHMVFKIGKALQPSVIFIDDCEKMFKKKLAKNDMSDPKRLRKELPKALKLVKGEDRILLVGTSKAPFEGEVKPMSSLYQRIIVIPRPDYDSRRLIWGELILRNKGTITNALDLGSLAKVTDGYTPGSISNACLNILTEIRLKNIDHHPLTASEFIPALSTMDPVFKEEEEAYKTWYVKTPLGKKRAKILAGDEEDPKAKNKKPNEKDKGKKKKK
ncbi:hypothetical protein HELRODRAFT_188756 [Helobdella robusta]|uniref:AAA+ ATPase domain-containing protein n=1 Tax=Helobdella robusta TaxID=6412 RepID=T1FQC0_HELRO|nr:hypothetical protein HELRODRAFT_188756 [Helobdella robusta]ESO02564.1 hypothetical protein HELRODRAFT_188756 [Helobdella robusta]